MNVIRCKRQQYKVSRSLYRQRQGTLMSGTGTCPTAWLNLSSVRYIFNQNRDVLVAYLLYMITTEKTDLTPGRIPAATPPACPALRISSYPSRHYSTLLLKLLSLDHLLRDIIRAQLLNSGFSFIRLFFRQRR